MPNLAKSCQILSTHTRDSHILPNPGRISEVLRRTSRRVESFLAFPHQGKSCLGCRILPCLFKSCHARQNIPKYGQIFDERSKSPPMSNLANFRHIVAESCRILPTPPRLGSPLIPRQILESSAMSSQILPDFGRYYQPCQISPWSGPAISYHISTNIAKRLQTWPDLVKS